VKGDRADRRAEAHLQQAGAMDLAGVADAEGLRRVKRGGRDQDAARPTSEWNAATSCGIASSECAGR
jgi:hypothetical protein